LFRKQCPVGLEIGWKDIGHEGLPSEYGLPVTLLSYPPQRFLDLWLGARVTHRLVVVLLRSLAKVMSALRYIDEMKWVKDDVLKTVYGLDVDVWILLGDGLEALQQVLE